MEIKNIINILIFLPEEIKHGVTWYKSVSESKKRLL